MARALLIAALLPAAFAGGAEQPVTSFEDDAQRAILVPRDTRYEVVTQGVSHGERAIRVWFSTVPWPALFFRPQQAWDLSEVGEISLDVTNPESEAVSFSVRVDDDLRADGTRYCRTGSGTIEPGVTATFSFPLEIRDPGVLGMRGWPVWPGSVNLGSRGSWVLQLAHIVQFQVFLSSPQKTRSLILDNVRFRSARPLAGIVDRFGQYTGADWPLKLYSEDEFQGRWSAEVEDLLSRPVVAGRDAYGGWADGPRREATGRFRVEKVRGKWWLVTPEGALFFSTGVNTVRPSFPTFLTSREAMFTWVPNPGEPFSRYLGRAGSGITYDFHSANLERKYGYPFMNSWRDMALWRLRSWGFNTIANWSETALFGLGIPYVTTTTNSGNYNQITVPGASSTMPDPFDSRWTTALAARLRQTLAPAIADPFCLGHFVDNELPWGSTASDQAHFGIPLGALAQQDTPAKKVFVDQLKSRYQEVQKLNQAWQTAYSSWEGVAPVAHFNSAVREDMGRFLSALARRYFRTVREQVEAVDPEHLYLGSRFSGSYNMEAVEAAAESADVVSFNIYQAQIDPARWTFLNALDRPCIIGEFHFGALDRGMFHTGLVAAPDQARRARMYQEYLQSALDHPAMVGAHWFQYSDQPLTGRTSDGENYNIGFVTVTDTHYPEMVEAARAIHAEMYDRRAGGGN